MTRRRLSVVGSGALLVNSLLFVLMERMSVQEAADLKAPPASLAIDFVRLKRQPEQERIKPREELPEKAESTPEPVANQMAVPKPQAPRVSELNVQMPHLDLAMHVSGTPFTGVMAPAAGVGAFAEAVPLVRTRPLYPPSALSRRQEGTVVVRFTVSEEGDVLDPEVVDATPPNVFDSSALRAIRSWKFRKKIVNGQAVPWPAQQTIIYKIEG